MWTVIIVIVLVFIIVMSIINIRSLVRKWRNNPDSWGDLLIGILFFGVVIGVLVIQLLKQLDVI